MVLISSDTVSEKFNKDVKYTYLTEAWKMLNEQRHDEQQCDVIITCQGRSYPAHKCVLISVSPYFKDLFSDKFVMNRGYDQQMKECTDLSEFSPECVKLLLEFIYLEEKFEPIEFNSLQMGRLCDFLEISTFDNLLIGSFRKDINLNNYHICLQLMETKYKRNIMRDMYLCFATNLPEFFRRGFHKDLSTSALVAYCRILHYYQPIEEFILLLFSWLRHNFEDRLTLLETKFPSLLKICDFSSLDSTGMAKLCEACPPTLLRPLLQRWQRFDAIEQADSRETLLLYSCVDPRAHVTLCSWKENENKSHTLEFLKSFTFDQDDLDIEHITSKCFFLSRGRFHIVALTRNSIFVIAYYDPLQEHFVVQYRSSTEALIDKEDLKCTLKGSYYDGSLVLALADADLIYHVISMAFPHVSSRPIVTHVVDCGGYAVLCRSGHLYSLVTDTHKFSQLEQSGEFVKTSLNSDSLEYTFSHNGHSFQVLNSGKYAEWQISYLSNGSWIKLFKFQKTYSDMLPPFYHNRKIWFINRDKSKICTDTFDIAQKKFNEKCNFVLPKEFNSKETICTLSLPRDIESCMR